jgi:hypothetical protein
MMEPMRTEGPFDFGDEGHLQRGFEVVRAMVNERVVRGHPMYVYYHRCIWGQKAILYRLRARVDLKTLHREESEKWRKRAA